MNLHDMILTASFSPEIAGAICLLWRRGRSWWSRLIEDSDGDPHHTDGIFLVILYGAVWCFHLAIIAAVEHIYGDRELLDVMITFLTAGGTLTGVRIAFKDKISPRVSEAVITKVEKKIESESIKIE